MTTNRRGFALLAVLWLTVALAGLTAGALAHARAGTETTAERVERLRSRWAAEGCLAVAIARLESLRPGAAFALPAFDTLHFANGAACTVEATDPAAGYGSPYGDGRLNVNAAPDSLLLALPGFSPEVVRELAAAHSWGRPITALDELVARLAPPTRAALIEHYQDLAGSVSFRATSLVLTAHGWTAASGGRARVELHVAPAGGRIAVLSRRLW